MKHAYIVFNLLPDSDLQLSDERRRLMELTGKKVVKRFWVKG